MDSGYGLKNNMFGKYQNIEIVNEPVVCDNPKRKYSKFWNEGKWRNFIAPLLPVDCEDQTFVEIGCNAGLFLKLAKERGFRNVVGVEMDKTAYDKAIRYRDSLGLDYKVLNRTVGIDFDFDEIPVADVTLLSNVHYYFEINSWFHYLDRLKSKTVYCLIVSRPLNPARNWWRPLAGIADIRLYFREWKEIGAVYNINTKNDPAPRELWSLMFRSRLRRKKFTEFRRNAPGDSVKLPRMELIKDVLQKENLNIEETSYYKAWKIRMGHHWSEERIRKFVQGKIDLLFDVKKNGLKEPILMQLDNKCLDGGHRIAILKEMGYKSVIVRIV